MNAGPEIEHHPCERTRSGERLSRPNEMNRLGRTEEPERTRITEPHPIEGVKGSKPIDDRDPMLRVQTTRDAQPEQRAQPRTRGARPDGHLAEREPTTQDPIDRRDPGLKPTER